MAIGCISANQLSRLVTFLFKYLVSSCMSKQNVPDSDALVERKGIKFHSNG